MRGPYTPKHVVIMLGLLAITAACAGRGDSPTEPVRPRPVLDEVAACDSTSSGEDSASTGCRAPYIPWF